MANGFELFSGIAFVESRVESLLFVDGILWHDGERGVALWPEHPGAVVVRAEAVTGDLEIGALSFEGLQGGRFSKGMARHAGVSRRSGNLVTDFHEVGFGLEARG